MGSPVPGRAWLQELPGQLKPALDESERPTTCLMYTLYLVEPVGPVGQVSLGPLNLEYSGREVLYELPGGGQAPWPGLLGAARALSGVGDPSFSLSRGAGIPARRQAILAGGWLQRAFAVINEVITKMHLNWSRSGRREMQGPECARALGGHLQTGPWLLLSREPQDTYPTPNHQDSGLFLHSLLVALSPQIKGSCTGLGQPSWGNPCSAAGPISSRSSQEHSGELGLGQ